MIRRFVISIIIVLAAFFLLGILSGCSSEPPEPLPPEVLEIATGSTPHPWIHQRFWDELADDESDDYNFECAHGIPFIRYDFSKTPMMVPYITSQSMRWQDYITRMMWQACGNMTTKQASRIRP